MSLSETYSGPPGSESPGPLPASPPQDTATQSGSAGIDPQLLKLRAALDGILTIAGEQHTEKRGIGRVYVFRGQLLLPDDGAYDAIRERFRPIGFTPMLQRERDEEAIVAIEGELPERGIKSRWWLHLTLLVITFVTTTIMGAALTGMPAGDTLDLIRAQRWTALWNSTQDGLPFSITLLTILGVHEMGHYVAARLHGVNVTLPFFIPLPLNNSLGTLGAVILIKSPLINRRALFDVGIAGPLAGLFVALPLYAIGLRQEAVVGRPMAWIEVGIQRVSNPPLLDFLGEMVLGGSPNLDRLVFYGHPMALAAWFGVLLTALNLLPLGQFDGGHVAYALLGRRAWPVAYFTFGSLIIWGLFGGWFAWLFWALMGLLTGLRHPPPHDDLLPLGWPRRLLGYATAVLFLLIIVPTPFYAP